MPPLILDLDSSVGRLPASTRVMMRGWHDRLRFACSTRQLRAFGAHVSTLFPASHGTVFYGSGDFHHLSLPLIERATSEAPKPVRVLVFDNHPDNMRFPFGVHCGSWVSRVAALRAVTRVDVIGITSGDIGRFHAWENRLWPLYQGRVRYWSIGVDIAWSRRVGLHRAFKSFGSAETLMAALLDDLARDTAPVYLSIDKDVLDPQEAQTNWDQGCLSVAQLQAAITAVRGRLIGSDVNGEISIPGYPQRWKRMLAAVDDQPAPDPSSLLAMQRQQHAVNLALCKAFDS